MSMLTKAWFHTNRSNIAFVSGIGLNVLGSCMLVKATKKNEAVIAAHKADMIDAKEEGDDAAKRAICRRTVKETAKNYSGAVAVMGASYALLGYSKKTDNKELAIVNAALTSVTVAYETVKERIINKYGDDEWASINGIKEEEVVDTETGEITSRTVKESDPVGMFSVLFDETNPHFSKRPGDNRRFVSLKLSQATADLAQNRIVMLLDLLGNPKYGMGYSLIPGEYFSKEQLMAWRNAGWYYGGEGSPTGIINFGLTRRDKQTEAFMLDQENSIWLEFNCCPNVYEEIDRQRRLGKL